MLGLELLETRNFGIGVIQSGYRFFGGIP